jgi:hypothetical protein
MSEQGTWVIPPRWESNNIHRIYRAVLRKSSWVMHDMAVMTLVHRQVTHVIIDHRLQVDLVICPVSLSEHITEKFLLLSHSAVHILASGLICG